MSLRARAFAENDARRFQAQASCEKRMKILIVSPEVAPFVPECGLAEFAGFLPDALSKRGHDVRIVTPKYKITEDAAFGLRTCVERLEIPISNRKETCAILEGRLRNSVPAYFVKNDTYYRRDYLYGDSQGDYPDNAERFIYFSRSILEICKALRFFPDIIHCCDWQSGLVPVYLGETYRKDPAFAKTATLFTVYELAHQGLFWHYDMHLTGLGWDLFTPDGIEYYGKINLLKAGVMWADVITTVSPTYSKEIRTKEFGHGLEGVFQYRSKDVFGAIHGVDYAVWNPETDTQIAKTYSAHSLKGKHDCKNALLEAFRLPETKQPVIGMISPLKDEKGIDLVTDALDKMMALGVSLIMMGTGTEKYHKLFQLMRDKYPQQLGVLLEDAAAMTHAIVAGADMLLMPSRYEPCGMYQLYALKYGTIPIVATTGNLEDTIAPFEPVQHSGTGFLIDLRQANALASAVESACAAYRDHAAWNALMRRAMAEDFSWNVTAATYEHLYQQAQIVHRQHTS